MAQVAHMLEVGKMKGKTHKVNPTFFRTGVKKASNADKKGLK